MKTILSILIACIVTSVECGFSIEKYPINLAYTSVAVARKSGWVYGSTEYRCINNCNPMRYNKCRIDSSSSEYECQDKEIPAPLAQTYRYRQTTWKICLSRCGKIGDTDYDWCYVDQKENWDYCNADTDIEWVRNQKYTTSMEPCKTDCTQDCGLIYCSYHTCTSYRNTLEYCTPGVGYDFARAKTVNNQPCLGICSGKSGSHYDQCYYGTSKISTDYCAEPLIPRVPDWQETMESLVGKADTHERVDDEVGGELFLALL